MPRYTGHARGAALENAAQMSPAPRSAQSSAAFLERTRTLASACLGNERGAVLVTAVFMSVFLVGMLYFLVGIAEAVFRRQGLGDAADAATFAAAILHARGMNLIAFINVVMAALLAVLVALRVVQAVCVVGILACLALAYPTSGASLSYVEPLRRTSETFGNLWKQLKPSVFQALSALHQAQRVTSYVVPAIAVLDSAREASQSHAPAAWGVVLPSSVRLPVEADEFSVLCGHAGANVGHLAALPFSAVPFVDDVLGKAGQTLAESASGFFCGGGSKQPPKYVRKQKTTYPEVDLSACEDGNETSGACRKKQAELAEAKPHEVTGHCTGEECGLRGPYERYAREARSACRPRDGFFPHRYVWQRREVEVEYVYREAMGWVVHRRYPKESTLEDTTRSPCGPGGTLGEEWELEPHPEGSLGQLTPLCAEKVDPPAATGRHSGQLARVSHVQATHLFSCEVQEVKVDDPMKGEQSFSDTKGKEPHRVVGDARLGDDTFQLRGVVWGEQGSDTPERVLRIATWGRRERDTLGDLGLDALVNFAVAQGEYYFDHDGSVARSEWLWDLKWTARLVRFRLPESDESSAESESRQRWQRDAVEEAGPLGGLTDVGSFGAVCEAGGAPESRCSSLDGAANTLDGLVLH